MPTHKIYIVAASLEWVKGHQSTPLPPVSKLFHAHVDVCEKLKVSQMLPTLIGK